MNGNSYWVNKNAHEKEERGKERDKILQKSHFPFLKLDRAQKNKIKPKTSEHQKDMRQEVEDKESGESKCHAEVKVEAAVNNLAGS